MPKDIYKWPANKLQDLSVTRVDLVTEGADSEAFIKLFKSKGGVPVEFVDILKAMKEEHRAVVEAELAKAKSEIPTKITEQITQLEGDLAKANDQIAKAKQEEPKEEDVLKSLDPVARDLVLKIKAKADASEAVVRKMQEQEEERVHVAKAKELRNLNVEEATLVELFKGLQGANLYDQVMKVLEQANTLVEKSAAFAELGQAGDTEVVDSWNIIEKKADELVNTENISKSIAITRVCAENPELYNAYVKAQN